MSTTLTLTGTDPRTGKTGSNSLSLDDAHAATLGQLILQTLGYQPTLADPDNPGQTILNPQTPGAAILEYTFGHLLDVAAKQARDNALAAATATQLALAAIPPPTLS